MPRYIDADAHRKFILSNEWKAHTQTSELIRLDNAPTADVEPVRHGRWIFNEVRGSQTLCCSICGLGSGTIYGYNYCPNCGARMGGDVNE